MIHCKKMLKNRTHGPVCMDFRKQNLIPSRFAKVFHVKHGFASLRVSPVLKICYHSADQLGFKANSITMKLASCEAARVF